MTKLSIIGKDYHTEEHVVGYYNKDSALKYETQLQAGKFILIAHGAMEEIDRAKLLLEQTHHEGLTAHTAKIMMRRDAPQCESGSVDAVKFFAIGKELVPFHRGMK